MSAQFVTFNPGDLSGAIRRFLLSIFLLIAFAGCSSESGTSSSRLKDGDVVTFTILQTSDLHNRVTGSAPSASYKTSNDKTKGSFARLGAKIKTIRKIKEAEGTPVLLFDTGDSLTGTLYDLMAEDNRTATSFAFFEAMKYDAITLGSNDFQYGLNFLPKLILNARGRENNGFSVPIIESNLRGDGLDNSDDDSLEELMESKIITDSHMITLETGLVVGVLGVMGTDSYNEVSSTISPSKFSTDLSIIQSRVSTLRSYNPDFVVLLAHAAVEGICECLNCDTCDYYDVNSAEYADCISLCDSLCDCVPDAGGPTGDAYQLTGSLAGVDIVLSGAGHLNTLTALIKTTNPDTDFEPDPDPDHGFEIEKITINTTADSQTITDNTENKSDHALKSVLISAGKHGEYLSQLDVTMKVGTGIKKIVLTNHTIDSSVEADPAIDYMVDLIDVEMDKLLVSKGMPEMNSEVGTIEAGITLEKPLTAGENHLGNLVSDSFRYAFKPLIDEAVAEGTTLAPTVSVASNGIIQSGLVPEAVISFADLFTVLPLGDSKDISQLDIPGYPLVKAHLTGEHVVNLCQFAAYTKAAQDPEFSSALSARTSEFQQRRVNLLSTTDFTHWSNELYEDTITGDNYYTVTYAQNAYAALVDPENDNQLHPGCDCDEPGDEHYFPDITCPCTDDDYGYIGASNIYRDGAALLSDLASFTSGLTPENYINVSGVKYSHKGAESLYKVKAENVDVYANTDYNCSGPLSDIVLDKNYPFTTDLFTILLLTNDDVAYSLRRINTRVVPKSMKNDNDLLTWDSVSSVQFRFDLHPDPEYPNKVKEELKCWYALYTYIDTELVDVILSVDYGGALDQVGLDDLVE